MNSEVRQCQNCKQNFTIESEDFDFYAKIKVPAPTFCPECRFQRRIAFRNERKLMRVKSAKSGKDIFSLYPQEAGAIYSEEEWWSDDWDPMVYGRDYDFSKPFFSQLLELSRIVPRFSLDAVVKRCRVDYFYIFI